MIIFVNNTLNKLMRKHVKRFLHIALPVLGALGAAALAGKAGHALGTMQGQRRADQAFLQGMRLGKI
jgi:hypothetical protein